MTANIQATFDQFSNDEEADGFDMEAYKRELDEIIAPVIPGKTV